MQTSGIRPADTLKQKVGPYELTVVEPFEQLHEHGTVGRHLPS